MWCPSKEVFDSFDGGSAFVACRWHELFDQYTPDTFHPKLYSLSGLVAEATMIGELHENHDAWGKHLKRVQEELVQRLERGIERTVCQPRHLAMIESVSRTESVRELVDTGRVLGLEGFQEKLEEAVRGKFIDFDIRSARTKKEDADVLLTSLATHAFRKGCCSDDTLNVDKVVPSGPDGVRQWILDALPVTEHEFEAIVAVQAASGAERAAVRAVCDRLGVIPASSHIPGLDGQDVMYLRGKSTGLRPIDAIEKLKGKIESNLNLLSLYGQSSAPVVQAEGWVMNSGRATLVRQRSPSFQNLHPRRNAVELANKAAEALGDDREETAIRAALDLHNLALTMSDHRLRLVNLWSGLECLASLVDGESIISRVERLVCPILAWRKPDKVVRYLSISIHRWLGSNQQIERKALPFRLGHNESVPADQILTLLTQPKDTEGIRSLLATVSGHPLLLHRLNRGWQRFHEPAAVHRDLTDSAKWLGWHLWRIYRARNLLVHQGIESDFLPQLANHLQQYLSWTLSRLLHGLAILGRKARGRDAVNLWKFKSEHLMTCLANDPHALILNDLFPEELKQPHVKVYPPQPSAPVVEIPPAEHPSVE